MTADADGSFAGQALFTGASAAHVVEKATLVVEDRVGDDLFVGGVVFRIIAGEEKVIFWIEQGWQVFLWLQAEPLKAAYFIKE